MIGLIMTKTKLEDPKALLARMAESKDRKNYLVDYLWRNKDKRVFLLPSASSTEDYCFRDRENVLKFITKHTIENPKHQIAVDSATQLSVAKLIQPFELKKEQLMKNIIDMFKNVYSSVKETSELRKWQQYSKSLNTAAGEGGYDGFYDSFQDLAKTETSLQQLSQSFSLFKQWDTFLLKVLSGSSFESYLKSSFNKLIENIRSYLSNYENMLDSKATQTETVDKMKDEMAVLNDQVAKGQVTIQEFEKKTKDMENMMKQKEEESKENERKSRETIDSLQTQLQQISEKSQSDMAQLIQQHKEEIQNLKNDYISRIDTLEKQLSQKSAKSGPSSGELIANVVCALGPHLIDAGFKYLAGGEQSDSLDVPEYPSELEEPEVNQITDDTSDPESD